MVKARSVMTLRPSRLGGLKVKPRSASRPRTSWATASELATRAVTSIPGRVAQKAARISGSRVTETLSTVARLTLPRCRPRRASSSEMTPW